MKLEDEKIIRRYLLGKLDEQELTQVEQRTMTDDDFFNHLQLVEGELLEECLCGELDEQEKVPFEQALLNSKFGRQKMKFHLVLKEYLARAAVPVVVEPTLAKQIEKAPVPVQPTPSWRSALAALWQFHKPLAAFALALIILPLAVSLWMTSRVGHLQSQIEAIQAQQSSSQTQTQALQQQLDKINAENAQLRNDVHAADEDSKKLEQQMANLRGNEKKTDESATLDNSVYAMILSPGADRGSSSTQEAKLTSATKVLQVTLKVTEDIFKSFSATVSRRDSGVVLLPLTLFEVRKGRSQTRVIFQAPASQFTPGEYAITLQGTTIAGTTEPVDKYYFRVSKSLE